MEERARTWLVLGERALVGLQTLAEEVVELEGVVGGEHEGNVWNNRSVRESGGRVVDAFTEFGRHPVHKLELLGVQDQSLRERGEPRLPGTNVSETLALKAARRLTWSRRLAFGIEDTCTPRPLGQSQHLGIRR